jgi:hypothetical protein
MLTIILISIILLTCFSTIFYYLKNKKLLKEKTEYSEKFDSINNLLKEYSKPIRKGYYRSKLTQTPVIGTKSYTTDAIIFVYEIDKYKSGESKIKIDDIEINVTDSNFDTKSAKDFIIKNFKSLKKTSEINWLESEEDIKEIRKEKLSKIKDSIK